MLYNLFLNSWGCSKKGWSMWSVWDAATVEDACDDVRRILTKSAAPLSACLVPLLCAQQYAFLLLSQPSFACCLPSPPASLSVRLFSPTCFPSTVVYVCVVCSSSLSSARRQRPGQPKAAAAASILSASTRQRCPADVSGK